MQNQSQKDMILNATPLSLIPVQAIFEVFTKTVLKWKVEFSIESNFFFLSFRFSTLIPHLAFTVKKKKKKAFRINSRSEWLWTLEI